LSKITKVRFFTDDKLALISEVNKKLYEKYYQSCTVRSRDTRNTTYRTYKNFFYHFLAYLAIYHENVGLYSDEFFENAVDIMESYIAFCQDTLMNNKKVINTKISTVSTFYNWSLKRGLIDGHPFDKKLERLKGANDEKIINSYFLTNDQIKIIKRELASNDRFDIQDQIIFSLMIDSANRIGAIEKLTLSSLDLDNMLFSDIREKRGYHVEVVFELGTKELIEEWLEMRRDMDDLKVDALFIAKHGDEYQKMARSTIQVRIKKIGQIIGLEDFHAHCIRKTRLNQVYEETGDLALAAELGNHKSTETTRSSYIKPKSKSELRDKLMALKSKTEIKEDDSK
jgi:integrase/recombinase XerC